MPWDVLSDEQRELRDLVRTLARERIAPRAAEIDETHEFPWDVVELFREHGLFGLFFDEEWGGTGTGTLLALVAIEEISKVCATSGLILAVQELGSLGLKLAGTQEQKERCLPKLASGEWLCAYALTEAGSGSDSAAMRTTARRDGDEYVLDGASASSRTPASRACTPSSRRPIPTPGTPGSPRSSSRRTRRASRSRGSSRRWGSRGSTTGELVFDGCRVPAANLLGEEGEGFRIAMRILDRSRPGRRRAGARDRAGRDRLRARVREDARDDGQADRRAPADRRRSSPTWRPTCEAARGLLYRFGQMVDAGVDDAELTKASAMAKLYCARRGDGGDDRGRPDPRRLRLHQGVPGRAHDARREDHADLRGDERDPAARDRARDAEGVSAPSSSPASAEPRHAWTK